MVCPECNRFPSKDTDNEPEGELEVSDDGMVTGDVRIFNTCENCGTELEETTFNVELDFSDAVRTHLEAKHASWLAFKAELKKVRAKAKKLKAGDVRADERCHACGALYQWHLVRRDKAGRRSGYVDVRKTDPAKAQCHNGGYFVRSPEKSLRAGEPELSVDTDLQRTDETQLTDRRGKAIRNPRYQRRYYGVIVEATVKCETCNEEIAKNSYSDRVQASGMESLV